MAFNFLTWHHIHKLWQAGGFALDPRHFGTSAFLGKMVLCLT
jgi:hypothetical protein